MRILIGLTALLLALPLWATTIAQLEFPEVIDTAELVFEGRVISVESEQTSPRTIHTTVRFQIIEVLKGQYSASELELRYLGGRVGQRELVVEGMQLPQPGEHGFYFVESLTQPMVHPLAGWSQGHFLILPGAGMADAVYTAEGQGVSRIDTPERVAEAPAILGHDGTARGVVVQQQQAPLLAPAQFKTLVRAYLANGELP